MKTTKSKLKMNVIIIILIIGVVAGMFSGFIGIGGRSNRSTLSDIFYRDESAFCPRNLTCNDASSYWNNGSL